MDYWGILFYATFTFDCDSEKPHIRKGNTIMPIPSTEQIAAYESAPDRIATTIAGLSDEQLLARPIPGEWSIHEILIHLPDSEAFGGERLRRTVAEERPTLHTYPESIWAECLDYKKQDYRLALNLFTAQRHANAALVRQLPEQDWERTGIHTERGKMSLYEIFQTYVGHAEAHLQQIEQVKKQL
jgi:uncharacterized damage-inducible protein DinB